MNQSKWASLSPLKYIYIYTLSVASLKTLFVERIGESEFGHHKFKVGAL